MDRRTFLRALAAVPVLGAVPALAAYRSQDMTAKCKAIEVDITGVLGWKPENIINVERWARESHRGQRCLLGGEDVTKKAIMCLPGEYGWAVVLNPDYPSKGWHTRPDGTVDCIATGRNYPQMPPRYVTRYGRVEIR